MVQKIKEDHKIILHGSVEALQDFQLETNHEGKSGPERAEK